MGIKKVKRSVKEEEMKVRARLSGCSREKGEVRGLFKMARLKGRVLRLAQRGAQ